MSEKKGPFDAAIEVLEDIALTTNLCRHIPGYKNRTKLIRAAIPVLEAAGKVDIHSAQFFIDGAANFGEGLSVINSDSSRYLYQTGEKQVRALLESLPEKEGK